MSAARIRNFRTNNRLNIYTCKSVKLLSFMIMISNDVKNYETSKFSLI